MARSKALAATRDGDEWVLAADTTVVCEGMILEKPLDIADARRMLQALGGREHAVLTGVCLRHQGWAWSAVETTRVRFTPLREEEIEEYAQSGEPMDKAGGYAIQGLASKFIDRIDGCYFNVMGLPAALVYRCLNELTAPAIEL
jgi:septum formation protein